MKSMRMILLSFLVLGLAVGCGRENESETDFFNPADPVQIGAAASAGVATAGYLLLCAINPKTAMKFCAPIGKLFHPDQYKKLSKKSKGAKEQVAAAIKAENANETGKASQNLGEFLDKVEEAETQVAVVPIAKNSPHRDAQIDKLILQLAMDENIKMTDREWIMIRNQQNARRGFVKLVDTFQDLMKEAGDFKDASMEVKKQKLQFQVAKFLQTENGKKAKKYYFQGESFVKNLVDSVTSFFRKHVLLQPDSKKIPLID